MTGGWSAENAILTDHQLLDTVRSTDLCNQLHDLGVPISSITANDEESAIGTFGYGQKDGGDKRLAVVWLLEDGDLLAKSGGTRPV